MFVYKKRPETFPLPYRPYDKEALDIQGLDILGLIIIMLDALTCAH